MGLVKKRVLLHTKDGLDIEGLLIRKRPEFVLEIAQIPDPDPNERVELDGRVRVLRENIRFYQELRR